VIGLAMMLAQPGYSQTGLQRLFTSPGLRAELDRRRLRSLQPQAVEEDSMPTELVLEQLDTVQPIPDEIYEVGGSMRRNDGSYTIWINNRALDQEDLPPHIELLTPYSKGYVRIRDSDSGATFTVKPGQVLNLSQGELMESYQYRALQEALQPAVSDPSGSPADAEATDVEISEAVPDPGNQSLADQADAVRVRDSAQ